MCDYNDDHESIKDETIRSELPNAVEKFMHAATVSTATSIAWIHSLLKWD